MAFEEGTEELACRACGAVHKLRWSRCIVRERSTVNCIKCEGIVYEGKGLRDYYSVRLKPTD